MGYKYSIKDDLCDFLKAYVDYYNQHNDIQLTVESLDINEKKFFNWCKKGFGSNVISDTVISDFNSALSVYDEEFSPEDVEKVIKTIVEKNNNCLDAYSKLLKETDEAISNLRGYDEFSDYIQTDLPARYVVSETDNAENILYKTAMQKNLYLCKMLSEEIFHVLNNCNALENDLTFEIFDQFVLNRQQKITKDQAVTDGSQFKEPKTKKLQRLYRDFCNADMLPEIDMLFKSSRSDNQRSFKEYVNNFFNGSGEEDEDENIIRIELSEAEVEEIAQCEAVNYAVACLFNAKGDLDPSEYVITKEDYQKFAAECHSDLTPESAHELADKYKNLLKVYDEVVVEDKKKAHSR